MDNSKGFLENTKCYKITCFDQNDDTVALKASHHVEIAKRHCTINYETDDWRKFWDALVFLFEVERKLYETEIVPNQNNLKVIYKQMF